MWTLPTSLPDHRAWKEIGFDTETYDPDLIEKGPGFVYDKAHMTDFCIYADDGYNEFFPVRRPNGPNFQGQWKAWLKELLSREDLTIVTANGRYDLEVMWSEGIEVRCKVVDMQVTEALLDENQFSYSLDSILKRRGLPTKDKTKLDAELVRRGYTIAKGKKAGQPDYSKMYLLEAEHVAEYGLYDPKGTYDVWQLQKPELIAEELETVVKLETALTPMLADMRTHGVRVNIAEAEIQNKKIQDELKEVLSEIHRQTYSDLNPFSTDQVAVYLDSIGIAVPKTEKDNDSVTNEFLRNLDDPVCKMIYEYRAAEKIRRDFIEGMILEGSYKERLYPQWFQTRGSSSWASGDSDETNGTRSGRIGCVNPNLSQIPARHPVYGPLVRGLFLPEDGELWCKADYNQQEPRILLHFAYKLKLPGAAETRQIYLDRPDTDYHQMMTDRVNGVRTKKITRRQGKDINLGLAYGLGKVKTAKKLNLQLSESNSILEDYHEANPFVRKFQYKAIEVANDRGFVRTVLGRRRRFNEWEAVNWSKSRGRKMRDRDAAIAEWGVVRRAMVHKALNSIVQGSAADQMKKAMLEIRKQGFRMLITLYDETGTSVKRPEDGKIIKEIMENAIPFEVPHYVPPAIGPNWGETKE
jgi:DNA polymerase I-like protein with 3'-5' exonuclease and polymerase domains